MHLIFRYIVKLDAVRAAMAAAITTAVASLVGGRSVWLVFRGRRCHAEAIAGDRRTTTATTKKPMRRPTRNDAMPNIAAITALLRRGRRSDNTVPASATVAINSHSTIIPGPS